MSFTLVITIAGLVALTPDKASDDTWWALLLDCSHCRTAVPAHEPYLAVPLANIEPAYLERTTETFANEEGERFARFPLRNKKMVLVDRNGVEIAGEVDLRKGLGFLQGRVKPALWGSSRVHWAASAEVLEYSLPSFDESTFDAGKLVGVVKLQDGLLSSAGVAKGKSWKSLVFSFKRGDAVVHRQALAERMMVKVKVNDQRIGIKFCSAQYKGGKEEGSPSCPTSCNAVVGCTTIVLKPRWNKERVEVSVTNYPTAPDPPEGHCAKHFDCFSQLLTSSSGGAAMKSLPLPCWLPDTTVHGGDGFCPLLRQ